MPTNDELYHAVDRCYQWNQFRPIGFPVEADLEDGTTVRTKTRTRAFLLWDQIPVVCVEAQIGAVPLDRVRAVVE